MKKFIITTGVLAFAFALAFSAPTPAEAACSVTSFTADDTSIAYGDSTTVSWNTSGCYSVSITPAEYPDDRPASGSVGTGELTQTTTFTATGYDDYGYAGGSRTLKITVAGQNNGGDNGSGGATTCKPTSFTAAVYTLKEGEGTVLHWDSEGCDSAAIHPADYPGDRPPYDSISTGAIFDTTEYTLTVYDAQGRIGGQRFLTIKISGTSSNDDDDDNECTINSFKAEDSTIDDGDDTDLRWTTTGCDYVDIESSDQDFDNRNADGSVNVSPDRDTTYTLRAYDEDGNLGDTAKEDVTVDDDNGKTCSIDSFSANPSTVNQNESTTLRWNTSGDVERVRLEGFSSSYSDDDSQSVRPGYSRSYTLTVTCDNNVDRERTVNVTVGNTQTGVAPQAITTQATPFGSTARLNGIAVPTSNVETYAWFQWGPSTALGYDTQKQTMGANIVASTAYADTASGLVEGRTYYYRAAVQNRFGISYGDIRPFTTVRSGGTTTVVKYVGTSTTTSSLIELKVESLSDRMCVEGEMEYTVSYKNISKQTLKDVVLRVNLPKELTYISGTEGRFAVTDNTLTVDLGTLTGSEEGTVTVRARVNESAKTGNLAVTTATVVYTHPTTRAQEDAIAYSMITVSSDCPTINGAWCLCHFLPDTLLEWLLLILVILALIVLGRQLNKKREDK